MLLHLAFFFGCAGTTAGNVDVRAEDLVYVEAPTQQTGVFSAGIVINTSLPRGQDSTRAADRPSAADDETFDGFGETDETAEGIYIGTTF